MSCRRLIGAGSSQPAQPSSTQLSQLSQLSHRSHLNPAQPSLPAHPSQPTQSSPEKLKKPSPLRLPNTRHDRRREVSPLHSMDILLTSPSAIQSFANLVNSYPFTISLRQGRAVIDAKSILGIYSLDLLKPVTIEIYSIQPTELLRELERYGT